MCTVSSLRRNENFQRMAIPGVPDWLYHKRNWDRINTVHLPLRQQNLYTLLPCVVTFRSTVSCLFGNRLHPTMCGSYGTIALRTRSMYRSYSFPLSLFQDELGWDIGLHLRAANCGPRMIRTLLIRFTARRAKIRDENSWSRNTVRPSSNLTGTNHDKSPVTRQSLTGSIHGHHASIP